MAYTTIDDPRLYFQNTLWTGTGGARTISGLSHKPDLIWTKTRTKTYNHMLSDSTRGFNANSEITTNGTAGSSGEYTVIVVAYTTPIVILYQCSSHYWM